MAHSRGYVHVEAQVIIISGRSAFFTILIFKSILFFNNEITKRDKRTQSAKRLYDVLEGVI
jgi:hypothetical protein